MNRAGLSTLSADRQELLHRFDEGLRPALAHVISVVEDERSGFQALLHELHPRIGRAHRIGITGPPGAGKSTLTAELIRRFRAQDQTVGVVAVDPTSPFTGGALLGDRIRMNDVAHDDGVFIRSMATRGSLGGLAVTTKEVADILDAFGFDRILVETVGVGQSELDIAAAADTTALVLVPESGDSIQTMKAGLMEAADLFVVNKADRAGADRLARELELMLHLRAGQALRGTPAHHGIDLRNKARNTAASAASTTTDDAGQGTDWPIPVLQTIADTGEGVDEFMDTLDRHRAWLENSGELHERRKERVAERVRDVVRRRLLEIAWMEHQGESILREALAELEAGTTTPYEVAARIVRTIEG